MTDPSSEVDHVSGVETTGHEWDGIRELNNPLPRWWLFVLMPAWPALPGMQGYTHGIRDQSDRADLAAEVAAMNVERTSLSRRLMAVDAAGILEDHDLSQLALALGESKFGDNCAICHGAGGRGAKGYPRLADDVWLWGGSLDDIEHTIRNGIRSDHTDARFSEMPAFGRDEFLTPAQIDDLVELVTQRSGRKADAVAAARAAPVFVDNCSSCHGLDSRGDRTKGSANLTDADWLYGGERADIRRTIHGPRNGVMPAWGERLDPATVRALAIYVHSLGGGE